MIDGYILRYTYYVVLVITVFTASQIVDKRRRLSHLLRGIAYVSPWIILPLLSMPLELMNTVFLLLATLGSLIISFYSEGYLRIMFGKVSPLQSIIDTTLAFIIIFFTSQRIVELVIMWIIVELMGSLLIMLERGMRAFNAIIKYLVVCVTAGDISLFLLLALPAIHVGLNQALVIDFTTLKTLNITLDPILTILLLIGFTTKLAQIPLHIWLIDTYTEAPSPSTAIFSGLMSKMAVFAILNIYYSINLDLQIFTMMLLIQGILTTLYGFFMTTIHSDLKKIMSYSSLGHYGVIAIILSLLPYNETLFTKLTLLYVLYHGFVKIQAFLNIASVEILTNTRDIYRLGYLAQVAENVYKYSIVTFLSLMGLPPTLGFYAKLALLIIMFSLLTIIPIVSIIIVVCIGLTSVFTIIYSIKYLAIYTSTYRSRTVKTTISLTNTQTWSEVTAAITALALTPFFLVIGLDTFIDTIVLIIYGLSMASAILAIAIRRRIQKSETKIWVGGVET